MLPRLSSVLVLLPAISSQLISTAAAAACSVSVSSTNYDLSSLDAAPHSFSISNPTPPTTTKITYSLSLCSPLPAPANPSEDVCPAGTHLCMTTISVREGLEDRIISVVPVAGEIGKGELNLKGKEGGENGGWILEMQGGEWNSIKHQVQIRMMCEKGKVETVPTFKAYDPIAGLLSLEWITDTACSSDGSAPPPPKDGENDGNNGGEDKQKEEKERGSSGMGFFGYFFTLFFLSLLAYFVLGAYHNYTQYGAQGWDLVPHRDVWRDLPYVVGDLFRGRSGNRSGYSALS